MCWGFNFSIFIYLYYFLYNQGVVLAFSLNSFFLVHICNTSFKYHLFLIYSGNPLTGMTYFWMTDSCPQTVKEVKNKAPFEVISLAAAIASALQVWLLVHGVPCLCWCRVHIEIRKASFPGKWFWHCILCEWNNAGAWLWLLAWEIRLARQFFILNE